MADAGGTWQFISTLLLKRPGKAHWLQDDIESFVLVVLYHGLRYANHNKIDKLHYIMHRVFDDSYEVNGTIMGGVGKHSMFLVGGYLSREYAFTGNPALTQWKQSAFKAIAQWIVHAEQKLWENESFHPSVGLGQEYALRDHKELARAFEIALSSQSWPTTDDKAVDYLQVPKRASGEDPADGSGIEEEQR
ncbi:hypothetical protein M378DRAFT_26204 [Amanita muscaria Koide BX008]|uniref:Uncharacterized protein n=1 Tax=Amanita muscaria (strain Koide BX008) TaxID=946122 RepID=A0A0C2WXK5_AMAMK|nr:hypothetical protein M378DRAFT_26204 [Amanita muscaria Koide BX008]